MVKSLIYTKGFSELRNMYLQVLRQGDNIMFSVTEGLKVWIIGTLTYIQIVASL
jgi:hypothetical protein